MRSIGNRYLKIFAPLTLASTAIAIASTPSGAVQFNFSYSPGTTLEQAIATEVAGAIWSSYLTEPVTVNIYVEMANDLPSNVLGGAIPGIVPQSSFDKYRQNLKKERTSIVDSIVSDNLNGADFDIALRGNNKDDRLKGIKNLNITRANAKAIGDRIDSNDPALDGYITISTLAGRSYSWNTDLTSNTVSTDKVDFLSVVLHELGHNAGFISGVDDGEWLATVTNMNLSGKEIKGKDMTYTTPLDLFRYSDTSTIQGMPDLEIGGDPKYFSVDRGITKSCEFATGKIGDGYQGSHWKRQDNIIGIMDPALAPGTRRSILDCDLQAMDAIGWEIGGQTKSLVTLQDEAKQRLAQRLGVTVDWLNANPTEAAQMLGQDRWQDVEDMIKKSEIYEWGSRNCQPGITGCWRQDGLWQDVKWQTISNSASQPVPEPSLMVGLFGLGGLGLLSLPKRRSR